MGQPHLRRLSFAGNLRSLGKGHMLVIPGFRELVLLAVHSFADEEIGAFRRLHRAFAGTRVRTVAHFQSLSGRPQHHIRGQNTVRRLDRLPLLQPVPIGLGDIQRHRALHVEFARSVKRQGIAVAGHVVIDAVSVDHEILLSGKRECLLRFPDLPELNLKGKLRRNDAQRIDDPLKPLGACDQKGRCLFRIAHSKEQSRQTTDMVCVIVGKKDHINRLGAPSLAPERHLCPLSAVDQNALSVISDHQGCQVAVGKRHHAARSQKTNIDHIYLINT